MTDAVVIFCNEYPTDDRNCLCIFVSDLNEKNTVQFKRQSQRIRPRIDHMCRANKTSTKRPNGRASNLSKQYKMLYVIDNDHRHDKALTPFFVG